MLREPRFPLWQAVVRLSQGSPTPFFDLMERDAAAVSMFEAPGGGWTIASLHRTRPDAGQLAAKLAVAAASQGVEEPPLEIAQVPATDWLVEAYAGFPPRRIGRFYVYGSHVAGPVPAGTLPLRIDAATAFGSGEHATTEGCLMALDRLKRGRPRFGRALDMGTGSGILAIATAKSWPMARVAAIDIDLESARVAGLNARLNGAAARVRAQCGNGFLSPLASTGPRFDLIVANILARPLIRMACSLSRRLAPGGIAILSGLLRRQEAGVLAAYRAAGLSLVARTPIGEWQTLTLGS